MFLQGGRTSKYVTLHGRGTCGLGGVWIKCVMSKHFSVEYSEYAGRFHLKSAFLFIKYEPETPILNQRVNLKKYY